MRNRNEAETALLEYVDNNYGSLFDALIGMAERNDATAAESLAQGDKAHHQLFTESANAWRGRADELRRLYRALPDDDGGDTSPAAFTPSLAQQLLTNARKVR